MADEKIIFSMIGVLKGISQLSFEVTNFTRLANTVFREKGGIAKEYSDGAKRSLIMWKALTELSGELSTLDGEREISAGSVEKALRAVSEMQSLSITPNILTSLLDEEKVKSDKRLSSKILDLSKIIIRYKDLLSEKYCDTGDDIDVLCDLLKEDASPVRDAVFFIDGFMSFTEPQYTLLKILIRNSSVTVHLSIPKEDPEAYEYTELLRTRDRLVRLSGSDSGGEAVTRVGELRSERDILLREIANLFHKSGGILMVKREKELLRKKMAEAIEKEDFEEAAKIRDRLRSLEKDGE